MCIMENLPDVFGAFGSSPIMLRQLLFRLLVASYLRWWAMMTMGAVRWSRDGDRLQQHQQLSIGMGLNLGLSIFCSQAHGAGEGALRNPVYLRRCLLVLLVAFACHGAHALPAIHCCKRRRRPRLPYDSARFIRVQLIGVPFYWVGLALISVCDEAAAARRSVG